MQDIRSSSNTARSSSKRFFLHRRPQLRRLHCQYTLAAGGYHPVYVLDTFRDRL